MVGVRYTLPFILHLAFEGLTHKDCRYTSMFNLVDYPCIAFPTSTIVDQKLDNENDAERTTYKPLSEEDKYLHDLCELFNV